VIDFPPRSTQHRIEPGEDKAVTDRADVERVKPLPITSALLFCGENREKAAVSVDS
jgi:hypothetical protein